MMPLPPAHGIPSAFLRPVEPVPPVIRGVGAVDDNTKNIAPAYPSGTVAGDLAIMFLETPGGSAITCTDWNLYGYADSGSTRLTVLWRRVSNPSTDNTSTSDSGDHQSGFIMVIQNGTFNPFNPFHDALFATSSATTSLTFPSLVTSDNDCLVINATCGEGPDTSSTTEHDSWSNASLTSFAEYVDSTHRDGSGGTIAMAYGWKSTAGTVSSTTASTGSSYTRGLLTMAITPYYAASDAVLDVVNSIDSEIAVEKLSFGFALRRLSLGYGGPCIRIQRTSDNTQTDIYWNANGGVDEDAMETFCGTGDGHVVRWYNQFRRHILYVDAPALVNAPKIVSSGATVKKNGRVFAYFDDGSSTQDVLYKIPFDYSGVLTPWLGAGSSLDHLIGMVFTIDNSSTSYRRNFVADGSYRQGGGNLFFASGVNLAFSDEASLDNSGSPFAVPDLDGTIQCVASHCYRTTSNTVDNHPYTSIKGDGDSSITEAGGSSWDYNNVIEKANLFLGSWNYSVGDAHGGFHLAEVWWVHSLSDRQNYNTTTPAVSNMDTYYLS